jgi:hypothetical protein
MLRARSYKGARAGGRAILRHSGFALVLIIAFWIADHGVASAGEPVTAQQRAAGQALLDAGKRAVKQGRYSEALRDFEQALTRLSQPSIHFYIGDTAARMGDDARAAAAFREYLAGTPNAPDRAAIERRIAAHERKSSGGASGGDLSPAAAAGTQVDKSKKTELASGQSDPGSTAEEKGGGGLWWLWTGIGVAVVASVVAAVIVTNSSDPVEPPRRGDVGGTIETLEAP